VQSHIERNLAVLSYDMDEKETIYGQELTARYHATDTWIRRNGQWQIVAGQGCGTTKTLRRVTQTLQRFAEYVGTYELAPGNTLTISTTGSFCIASAVISRRISSFQKPPTYSRKGVEGRIFFATLITAKWMR
jgi:hypothetical protein